MCYPLWPVFMLCVCENCLNVLGIGKQTQTISIKYREKPINLGKTKKTKEQKTTRDSWLDPPFPQDFPRIDCFVSVVFLFLFVLFLAPPRSKYCLALPAATKNIQKILVGNPPPPESLKI